MREYRFVATYELKTPLRLSSGEQSPLADTAIRRRADGLPIVPGTSIGGACRQYIEELIEARCLFVQGINETNNKTKCGCKVCDLFGDMNPSGGDAFASKLTFFDAPLNNVSIRIGDSIAIERKRRVIADAKKFDQEEIAAGPTVSIEVRGKELTDDELSWVSTALEAIGSGALPLGGRKAQGFGRLETKSLSLHCRDSENSEHFLKFLLAEGGDEGWPQEVIPIPSISRVEDQSSISFEITPIEGGTFAIGDPSEAIRTGFDRAPRLFENSAVLPTTSFRGALRATAERIIRSISSSGACDPTDKRSSCSAQVLNSKNGRKGDNRTNLPRCLICRLFGNEEWASWLRIDVRTKSASSSEVPFDHVAIDRFTGGAREGLKFDNIAATGGTFSIRCSLHRAPKEDLLWAHGLLALSLQELQQGRMQIGYGSARGHGWFRISSPPKFDVDLSLGVKELWGQLNVQYPEASR